jgi:hypothetical protein
MSSKPVALQEQVIIVIGGYSDAPGFKIVSDGHGGFKIVPIPGWNPEQSMELGSALKVAAAASQIKQPEASQAILNAAAKLANAEIGRLVGSAGAGQTTVVVVGQ